MKTPIAPLLLFLLLCLSGCGQGGPLETPVYNNNNISPSPPSAAVTPTAAPSAGDLPVDDPMPAPVFFTDFTGVEITEEAPAAAGSPFGNLYNYGKPGAFCAAEDSDILYYVNFGKEKNNYLYAYENGSSELLIDMPVNYPALKNGSLYFISNDNFSELYGLDFYPEGRLYQYDLADQTIRPVLDRNVWDLRIVGDYLYFRNAVVFNGLGMKVGGNEAFRLSLDGGEPEAIGDALPYFYGEYQLQFSPPVEGEYRALELVSPEQTIPLTGKGFTHFNGLGFCIDGDILWFMAHIDGIANVVSLDLQNGETMLYPANPGGTMESFAVVDGEIFITSQAGLYRFDTASNRYVKLTDGHKSFRYACTDGRYLYAIATIGERNAGMTTILSRFIPDAAGYREVDLAP